MTGLFIRKTILSLKGEVSMKISQVAQKINQNQVMGISVDVHKDMPNFFETESKEYSDECSNRTTLIKARLQACHPKGPRVICTLGKLNKLIRHRKLKINQQEKEQSFRLRR
jgi:hypothetical protein